MPDDRNPIGLLGAQIGSSIADLAAGAFNTAMKALWDFALTFMGAVMGIVDHLTNPDLNPKTGPLAAVFPSTWWVGGVLLVVLSLIGALVGEFVGSDRGLGNLIQHSQSSLDTAGMFAVLAILAAVGMTATAIVRFLHRRIVFWERGAAGSVAHEQG